MTTEPEFCLPGKLESYLATLSRLYKHSGERLLAEIVVNGAVSIHEGWDYDNWNGGTYGHAVTLTVPEDLYLRLMEQKDDIETRIAQDINKLNNTRNEHVSQVFIELEPANDPNWRQESGMYRPRTAPASVAPEALQRIWGGGHVRVFLSHKASVKAQVSELKKHLANCGVAAFVAHEDIEPTAEWQREIEQALFTMDALVALLTKDYHDSNWTDQEAGVAIGRGVPVIPIRLGTDPYGLMGKFQALGQCDWNDIANMAAGVFKVLYKCLSDKSRLFECALHAYAQAQTWNDSAWKVQHLLSLFDTLTRDQVSRILTAFEENSQNHNSFEGRGNLQTLLKRWTGQDWRLKGNRFVSEPPHQTAEPF